MTDRNYVEKRSQNHSNTNQFQIEIGCNVEVSNDRRDIQDVERWVANDLLFSSIADGLEQIQITVESSGVKTINEEQDAG